MKSLRSLLQGVEVKKVTGDIDIDIDIQSICFDSREAEAGCVFCAVPGVQVDGHRFIPDAVKSGCVAVICEQLPRGLYNDVTYVVVENSAVALGQLASAFYGHPSNSLQIVGVTGTNGKTSTVNLLHGLFQKLGYKVGLLSTIHNKIGDKVIAATHTTPDALQIQQLLSQMVEEGCSYCFMEVSSHALMQDRVAGLTFAGGVFLNITHDHLDYHGSFQEYIRAKKKLFDLLPPTAFALTNVDDKRGAIMVQNTEASVKTFALKSPANFNAKIVTNSLQGLELRINGISVWVQLIGAFNANNLLAAYSVASLLDQPEEQVLQILSVLQPIKGRMEKVNAGQSFIALVDYAHTPDALEKVLLTLNQLCINEEKMITVIGCGGDRDSTKRPLMAKVAARLSSTVILTADNPRSEDPLHIIEEMRAGLTQQMAAKTEAIPDREVAIKTACQRAHQDDIVLIAGKGHETYQEINGEKLPFDDVSVLKHSIQSILSR